MSYEFELINKLRQQLSGSVSLRVGPGDDTAVVQCSDGTCELLAADMLLGGVHFEPDADPRLIGRKALAVNLSDIAAMGGTPKSVLISVALPKGADIAEPLHDGLFELAREFDVQIAGGDTNSWDGPLVINVAVTGELAAGEEPFLRSGAKVGDWICCTGPLGGSIDGHHLSFTPRVLEALSLRDATTVSSMIDISDGLASDLHHILTESKVGAELYADRIPLRDNIASAPDALQRALGDGEDFELLFTAPSAACQSLLAEPPAGCQLFHVGKIVQSETTLIHPSGDREDLKPTGWQHCL
jgi:thiamine-monophosphate kinase